MRKRRIFLVLGMTAFCLFAGCKQQTQKVPEDVSSFVTATPATVVDSTRPVEEILPAEGKVTLKEEGDEAKDGETVYFTSNIIYPFYEGEQYATQLNTFVNNIVEEFRQSLPDAKENAALDYKDCKESGIQGIVFPETESFTVSCLWETNEIEVFSTQRYSNAGGVHPNIYYQFYVVEKRTGKAVSIEEILEPYGIAKDVLEVYVAEKIKEENADELYQFENEEDYQKVIRSFLEENQWYLNGRGLVVLANPYDIAPYAAGVIECKIPYEVLEQGLKK